MTFTREFIILAATVLAWFGYALTVNDPNGANPLIAEVLRDSAWVLSGIVIVRLTGFALLDGLADKF